MATTKMELRNFMNREAERVLAVANGRMEELKHLAEKSKCYSDISIAVHEMDELKECVNRFKENIPDDSWADWAVIDHMKYFVERADSVLSKCK